MHGLELWLWPGGGKQHGISLIRSAVERGVTKVVLWTAARNQAAQHLFAAAGFRPTMIEMTRERGDPKS